jgi:hypothetical protein
VLCCCVAAQARGWTAARTCRMNKLLHLLAAAVAVVQLQEECCNLLAGV